MPPCLAKRRATCVVADVQQKGRPATAAYLRRPPSPLRPGRPTKRGNDWDVSEASEVIGVGGIVCTVGQDSSVWPRCDPTDRISPATQSGHAVGAAQVWASGEQDDEGLAQWRIELAKRCRMGAKYLQSRTNVRVAYTNCRNSVTCTRTVKNFLRCQLQQRTASARASPRQPSRSSLPLSSPRSLAARLYAWPNNRMVTSALDAFAPSSSVRAFAALTSPLNRSGLAQVPAAAQ